MVRKEEGRRRGKCEVSGQWEELGGSRRKWEEVGGSGKWECRKCKEQNVKWEGRGMPTG
jgi:hypothetical protein